MASLHAFYTNLYNYRMFLTYPIFAFQLINSLIILVNDTLLSFNNGVPLYNFSFYFGNGAVLLVNLVIQVLHDILELANTSCGVRNVQNVSGYLVFHLGY